MYPEDTAAPATHITDVPVNIVHNFKTPPLHKEQIHDKEKSIILHYASSHITLQTTAQFHLL